MSLLEIHGLEARYGDFQALFGIAVTVDEGEAYAVIGANGAGKSTLLNTLAGLLPVAGGEITFDGKRLNRMAVHDRVDLGITLVPEGRRIFPSLTVEENLLLGGFRRRNGQWTVGRVYDTFELLRPLAKRSAARLSGGEQQTLAIGRALMANPRLLLLDEVSLGLAPIVVHALYDALGGIAAEGTTLVLVEQNIAQALRAADRFACLVEGRVSLAGACDSVSHDAITDAYFGMAHR